MARYFCLFVFLFAVASAQQVVANLFMDESSPNPQKLSSRSTSHTAYIFGNLNGIEPNQQGPNSLFVTCSVPCRWGFSCQNGQCVRETPIDRCATIRCGFGNVCRDGRCVQPTPVDNCAPVTCPFGSVCRDGRCTQNSINSINVCLGVRCPEGSTCQNGRCVVSDRCSLVRCGRGQECRNGQCVSILGFCGGLICHQGSICSNNKCIPWQMPLYQCYFDADCKRGQSCENNQCVPNKCSKVSCFQGQRCENGNCVPNILSFGNSATTNYLPNYGHTQAYNDLVGYGQGLNRPLTYNLVGQSNQNVLGQFSPNLR